MPNARVLLVEDEFLIRVILRPRENPKIAWRVDPDFTGVSKMRPFRVLTWTEYILAEALIDAGLDVMEAAGERRA